MNIVFQPPRRIITMGMGHDAGFWEVPDARFISEHGGQIHLMFIPAMGWSCCAHRRPAASIAASVYARCFPQNINLPYCSIRNCRRAPNPVIGNVIPRHAKAGVRQRNPAPGPGGAPRRGRFRSLSPGLARKGDFRF